ncbi:hypothetical protein QOT17_019029 [Balamuthia mandrillaris]
MSVFFPSSMCFFCFTGHRKLYTGSVAVLIFFIVCTFLLAGVLYIPFFLLNYVASFVVNTGIQQQGFWAGMYDLLWQVSIFVPLATLGVYRLFSSTLIRWGDHAFFYTLDDIDAELSAELKRRKPIPVLQWFLIYMRRVARLLLLSSLIYLWSCLPYVGFLALPFAHFYVTKKTFGTTVAICVALLALIPAPNFQHFLLFSLEYCIATLGLSRELLEPYYARSEDYFKEPAKQRQRHAVLMFGFGLPFALGLSVPFVGVLCWGLAQGSTAALVVRLLQREAGEEEESGGAESGKRGGEGGEATKKKVVRRGIQSSRVSVLV